MSRGDTRVVGGEALFAFASATLAATWMSWGELPGRSGLIPLTRVLASWLPIARGGSWVVDRGLASSDLARGLKYFAASTAVLLPLGMIGFGLHLRTGLPMPAPEPLAHVVVTRKLEGFGVVLPGLLFAWLRARSGSLLAPMLSHGVANVVTRLLLKHAGAR